MFCYHSYNIVVKLFICGTKRKKHISFKFVWVFPQSIVESSDVILFNLKVHHQTVGSTKIVIRKLLTQHKISEGGIIQCAVRSIYHNPAVITHIFEDNPFCKAWELKPLSIALIIIFQLISYYMVDPFMTLNLLWTLDLRNFHTDYVSQLLPTLIIPQLTNCHMLTQLLHDYVS